MGGEWKAVNGEEGRARHTAEDRDSREKGEVTGRREGEERGVAGKEGRGEGKGRKDQGKGKR